jgi:predicted phosphodiesterase
VAKPSKRPREGNPAKRESATLPESINRESQPCPLDQPGWWLVLGDVHLPYHDRQVVEQAVRRAKRNRAVGVLLNGDVLDCHEISRFDKSPDDPRYNGEVAAGRQFLHYLRAQMPRAQIVFKEGNHEERLYSYLFGRAPALFGLDVLTWPSLLHFRQYGVEHVGDRRVVHMGKLNVIHGHEYRPNIQAPVNPARGLFLRAKSVAMCGHFHQTSEHHEPNINGKAQGAWSSGCACGLKPLYMPLNKWNHGFALVHVGQQGDFEIRNLRVLNGEVL